METLAQDSSTTALNIKIKSKQMLPHSSRQLLDCMMPPIDTARSWQCPCDVLTHHETATGMFSAATR